MGLKPIWSKRTHCKPNTQGTTEPRHRTRRSLFMESLESRQLMAVGPQLQSILPNEGADLLTGTPLSVAPRELVFRFTDGQTIDATTLSAIRLSRSVDGVFGNGNDQLLVPFDPGRPGFVGIGDRTNEVIIRFPSVLPDDMYQITIAGAGAAPLRNISGDPYNDGVDTTTPFELQLAPQVLAVVPQPITSGGGTLTQARDQIEVYFNANDPLDAVQAQNPAFYQLIFTNDTATNADDVVFNPTAVVYDGTTAKVTLTFASDLALLPTGVGTYRLRLGDSDTPANSSSLAALETPVLITPAADPGSSYATAQAIGALSQGSGTSTMVINAAIDPQPFPLALPGGSDEPGHRDHPLDPGGENHLLVGGDAVQGISTIFYNFQSIYGFDPQNNPLFNGITETQKQRVREIFEFYGHYIGAQFAETPNAGITVAVGDMRAVDPLTTNGPGGTLGITDPLAGLVVMDLQEPWGNSEFGGFFFTVTMHEIGHALGLGHATELPDLTVNSGTTPGSFGNTGELVFPGDYDIVHGRHLYRPEAKDIDLYQFQLNESGTFTAETTAERLPDSSLLDSVITLFEQYATIRAINGGTAALDGALFTIDDGVNAPVTFELDLDTSGGPTFGGTPITYSAGDSPDLIAQKVANAVNAAASNTSINLAVRAEADGGVVKLRGLVTVTEPTPNAELDVRADVREMVARNDDYFSEDSFVQLHLGPGRYFVGVTSTGNTNYDPTIDDSGFGGTTQGVYQLRLHFNRDALPIENIVDESGTILDGDGDGRPGGAFNYWMKVATEANTIYVDKTAQPFGNGSLAAPFNEIDLAIGSAAPGRIVRVVGNGGLDGDIKTVADAVPYTIGFNSLSQVLPDGNKLEIPRGVTLMIDAGAVFKMRAANIDVGSSAQGIDRSEGYLQVLGIPQLPVVFTSTRDETLGQDIEPSFPTFPSPSDWGGLVFRNDLDLAVPTRRVLEQQGIFLNYVNAADIRYGGGQVTVNSTPQTFNPIHMIQARPTVTNNIIVGSADAAMSADPNSFLESHFQDNVGGLVANASLSSPIVITTTAAHGLTTGDRIVVKDVLGNDGANGSFTITVTGPNTFILNGSIATALYTGGGTWARAYTADYDRVGPDIHTNQLSTLIVGAPIDIVGATNSLPLTITTASPHNLTTGNRVRISGVQGNLGANGDYTVTVTSTTTFILNGAVPTGNYIPSGGDTMTKLTVLDNSLNGLFIRIRTQAGNPIDRLTVPGRFDDIDITHIITQALIISGTPGGPIQVPVPGAPATTLLDSREDARLTIDPGMIVKLQGGRIETQISAQLLAEGTAANPVVFTTLNDDRYGSGGSFDANADRSATSPALGGWGGLFFDRLSHGSLDHVLVTFAGGRSTIEGGTASFNAIEIHQADVRIANSMLRDNAAGQDNGNRNNRGTNGATTIFVRGAQPVIVDNTIRDNQGQVLNINANSLNADFVYDGGRSIGPAEVSTVVYANHGPLVRGNRLRNNEVNGMVIRGAVLTTESIWDDTDIAHVLFDEVETANHHTFSGLRLQSNPGESLVVKMNGANAGFTAGGRRLDISDRIGGTLQIVGTSEDPVILTALTDDSATAGFDPDGAPMGDTNEAFRALRAITGQAGAILDDRPFLLPSQQGPQPFVVSGAKWGSPTFGTGATVTFAFMGPGVQDSNNLEGGWTNTPIQTPGFMPAGAMNEIRRAFAAWSAVANITFVEVTDGGEPFGQPGVADIRIGGHVIDGLAGPTLGHGFFPSNPAQPVAGDLHFDVGEIWQIGTTPLSGTDIFSVALHEIGHTIGLRHTTVAGSIMEPAYNPALIGLQPDDIAGAQFIYGRAAVGNPGAWRSVRLEQFSNDRNVVVVNELESATATRDINDTPGEAQFVGALATDEKHSDEILRLGFEIHGHINLNDTNDEDVYSFDAQTGTEVWFDIDRTTHSLDTIIELIDANGVILARSDNSPDESVTGVLPGNPDGPNLARLMQRDAFHGNDLYTTNPRDAGMRVLLPGAVGLRNTYFIRVRSKGGDALDPVNDRNGITRGAYQLQIRLRETDEVPGSAIKNSDIRFAVNGIELIGLPDHSPLLGDASEVEQFNSTTNTFTNPNDTTANAQDIGNLMLSDRGSLSVAGTLSTATDVDIYRITVDYDLIQALTGIRSWATMFDIDYADGIARPDTTISIFDANGVLRLIGRDSDVAEDQPGPLEGIDADDLSRGSFGKLDSYIGSVQLPESAGRTYFIAVSSNNRLPEVLDAQFEPNATAPLVRLEPVTSVRRIVEDRIGFVGGTTAAPSSQIFNATTVQGLNAYASQFQLSDVVMFVNGPNDLFTVDPLTGIQETDVTGNGAVLPVPVGGTAYRDITMRNDGRIFAFAVANTVAPTDANNGILVELDPGTGAILQTLGPTIDTQQFDPMGTVVDRNRGVSFEALDFLEIGTNRRLFAAGTVPGGTSSGPVFNVLYEFNALTGVPVADGVQNNFPPSEPLPRGFLNVGLNGATVTTTAGSDPNLGDGDTFTVGGTTLEMDSGITIEVVQPGAAIPDGATFSVTDNTTTVLYRFDKDPTTQAPPGAVEVPINNTMSAAQVAAAIAANFLSPISQVPPQAPLPNPLNGVLQAVHLQIIGQGTRVYIEDLTPNSLQHSASTAGNAALQVLGQVGVQPGNRRVYFTPLDPLLTPNTRPTVAQRIETALAQNPIPNVTATALQNVVTFVIPPLSPPLVITIPVTTPFTTAQLPGGFGGNVTGMQFLNGSMFAVTDTGTLLRYDTGFQGGILQQINAAFAINLNQIPFSGLSLGPQNLDVDRDGIPEYAQIFFATAADGRLYAFDEFGSFQPIFADGATSVFLGGPGAAAEGIAFSTLDYNLWHVTNRRGGDAGHGINTAFDNSRTVGTQGGTSFYFGLEDPRVATTISNQPGAANYIPQATDPRQQNVFNTYQLPGGAHGSLTTDTFSLAGYVPTDKPVLYFNYFLQTQDANAITNQNMRDAFRVFVSNDGVDWSLLGSNNSILSFPRSNAFGELADHLSVSGGDYRLDRDATGFLDGDKQRVQELYDNTNTWRQARVDLGDFAGMSNLRLRFDFSTAASMDVGGLTVGEFLQALPGSQLRDGQTFSIDFIPFEFDSGITLVAPAGAGAAIGDGETFTISDGINPAITFEFDNNNTSSVPAAQTILITSLDSAETVAQKVATAVAAVFPPAVPLTGGVTPHLNGHRVNLEGAASVTRAAVVGVPRMLQEGSPGVAPGNTVVTIHEGMTDLEVAQQMALVIDAQFALNAGTTDSPLFQTTALLDKARLQFPAHSVTFAGPLSYFAANTLPGDQFGNFNSAGRGQQNNFEGVFIDDLMVSFAERGEMVTGLPAGTPAAPGNTNFDTLNANPRTQDPTVFGVEQLTGEYQLEVRRGAEYGNVLSTVNGFIDLFQTFDTNDRLTQDFTLTLPPGSQIHEGQSFEVDDGLNVVTFEFDSDFIVAPGAVAIPYTNVSTAAQLAQTVMNAINSNLLLQTTASANISGARVNLVGAAFATTGGTTLGGDLTTESNDTIALAVDSGLSTANPGNFIANGVIGDNPNLFNDPSLDVDMVSLQLNVGDRVRIDIDASQLGSPLDSVVELFDASGFLLAFSDDTPAPGEGASLDSYLEFVATTAGTYYVGISGFDNFNYDPNVEGSGFSLFGNSPPLFSQGDYTVIITVGSGVVGIDQYDFTGDENQFREQGQILIDSNRISHFSQVGIVVDAGQRDPEGNIPRQPSVRNLREINTSRLVPGVAIQNNLITDVGQVGIVFSGDTGPANQPVGAVPFGRIVNNTIWGGLGTTGLGIQVTNNASPSIINNILANLGTGITVDPSSRTVLGAGGAVVFSGTEISANLYRNANTTLANTGAPNNGLGDFAIVLTPNDPLFENEALGVFSPARGSQAIDSSLDSLQDRPSLTTVTSPLGIGLSPILAPDLDLDGVERVDDPSQAPPPGLGANVFKDRGALEHVDQPLVNITGGSVTEGNLGNTALTFTVTLDQFSNSQVILTYTTFNNTALGGADYVNATGQITFQPGGPTVQFITVQVIGDTLDEDDETFLVTLTDPVRATIINGQANGTIIDDDNSPNIAINNLSVVEGSTGFITPMVFSVTLNQASGRNVTAAFNTANVTATGGSDYQVNSGVLTFTPGQTSKTITVNIIGDITPETNETFQVVINPVTNANPATGVIGIGTILEDEPSLSINSVSVTEGNAGTKDAVFTVNLTPAVATPITVVYSTAAGTATAGTDFQTTTGTLTFAAGQTVQNVTIRVIGDTTVETNETFTVTLSGATGAGVGAPGTGTIVNDDSTVPPMPPPPPVTAPFIVTSPGAGGGPQIQVLDAATLQQRFSFFAYSPSFTGGVHVATGDVNNDGIDDIITAPAKGGGPYVRVFNGATGAPLPGVLGSFAAFETNYFGGVYVAAGDVNFDGRDDIIVAQETPIGRVGSESAFTRIRVFNGINGGLLREFTFRKGSTLVNGIRVAMGDINGDNRPEIIASGATGGRVQVFDALAGNLLRDFAPFGAFTGEVFVSAGDLNRDGRDDIFVGAGRGGGPNVKVFSGLNNAKLAGFFAYDPAFTGGVRVGSTDLNQDGVLDIITAPGSGGGPNVKVFNGVGITKLKSYMAYNSKFTGGVFVAGSGGGSPLMAAGGQSTTIATVPSLTQAELQPIVNEALARWSNAQISSAALQKLKSAQISIADLPDGVLGLARADRIYVDINGAGYGWFVDSTPGDDAEFSGVGGALERMDLLSAVMHEMGHLLGLDHEDGDAHDVMAETLALGHRRGAHDSVFDDHQEWLY